MISPQHVPVYADSCSVEGKLRFPAAIVCGFTHGSLYKFQVQDVCRASGGVEKDIIEATRASSTQNIPQSRIITTSNSQKHDSCELPSLYGGQEGKIKDDMGFLSFWILSMGLPDTLIAISSDQGQAQQCLHFTYVLAVKHGPLIWAHTLASCFRWALKYMPLWHISD